MEQNNSTSKKENWSHSHAGSSVSFGLASIFFFEYAILPLAAIIFAIMSFWSEAPLERTHRKLAIAGLILGMLYLLCNFRFHGHLR